MAEYSNTRRRGMLVGMVFSMQSLGLLAGPLVMLGLLFGGVSPVIAWRLLLAFGAIPAVAVIYGRRKMPEPPKFTVGVKGNLGKAASDLAKYTGLKIDANTTNSGRTNSIVKAPWYKLFTDRRLLLLVIGTAGSWFLMDWALYGNTIMSSSMLSFLVPSTVTGIHKILLSTEYSALVFGVAALPGYWLATFTTDRIGFLPIQIAGFAMMVITFGALGIFHELTTAAYVVDFLLIYGLSYFFIEFGPNATTFIYPPEVFPVSLRGLGSGTAVAGGKMGAFIGTVANVFIVASLGLGPLFMVLAFLSAVGLFLTLFALPEPKRKDIEVVSGEERFLVPAT